MHPTFLPKIKKKIDEKRIDIQSLFNIVRTNNKQPFIITEAKEYILIFGILVSNECCLDVRTTFHVNDG